MINPAWETNADDKVYAYTREKGDDKVLVIINLSNDNLKINLDNTFEENNFKELFSDKLFKTKDFELSAWEYNVFFM